MGGGVTRAGQEGVSEGGRNTLLESDTRLGTLMAIYLGSQETLANHSARTASRDSKISFLGVYMAMPPQLSLHRMAQQSMLHPDAFLPVTQQVFHYHPRAFAWVLQVTPPEQPSTALSCDRRKKRTRFSTSNPITPLWILNV
ncbi:hypothetical protein SERLA73DRAFT_189159 [Serpula lacrymans var. lacrymans S7.3]|uniref:Uncharacterized protein n=2 Tax=Serpula lacrymans var. lacrymans TaxID=341189 RepID=F8QCY4_SERL3|nr:uncharacterized protein SERLADRAFT_479861 [Serpula lacrymans var. lacrymans S7.9]EGN93999.1 hypothetical protein SERLA73DRAFT_189159 [Serpula lacrymans var. lacrymans S7.3]EGO19359.1 hypothetical protein SERLADRAFT_479861 [Serpula lacrymans var. lacrymans S7.9]